MTQSFQDMLYLFSCGAHGITPNVSKIESFENIIQRAAEHGVAQIIYPAVKKLVSCGYLDISGELFRQFKNSVIGTIISDTHRKNFIHKLYKEFEKAEISYCVLKGETLSALYHDSQFRISSDTDIFVEQHDFSKTLSILKEQGFKIEPVPATSHHSIARHNIGGLVEIHHRLYDVLIEDAWFGNKNFKQEPYKKTQIADEVWVPALGITDGMLFIALHYVKHFLEDGVGIRQLMDMLLYMKEYKDKVDWKRFNLKMEELSYGKFIAHSIGIGVEYLRFKKEDLPQADYDKMLLAKILDDLEDGGIFGKKNNERKGFYLEYTKVRLSRFKTEKYGCYIKKWWRSNTLAILFPSSKRLEKKFKYLRKTVLLYPIAWVHRAVYTLGYMLSGKRKLSQIIKPANISLTNEMLEKRMGLVEELDMI